MSIELPNASYTYTAATSATDWSTPAAGGFTVAGAARNEPVPFTSTSVAQYAVTFTESGLPSGATWYMNITGEPGLSATVSGASGTMLSIDLRNATYSWTASTSETKWTTSAHGPLTVAGLALSEPVPFTLPAPAASTYSVTFTESGLPLGATWYVNITGQVGLSATVSASSGTTLTTALVNGTYSYSTATSSKGWSTAAGGAFSISGAAQGLTVTFTSSGGTTAPASTTSPPTWTWIVVALVIVIALLVAIFVIGRRRKKDQTPASTAAGSSTSSPKNGP